MSTDVLYPLLIGAGCLVLVVGVHLLTRPRPSRGDIRVPETPPTAPAAAVASAAELEGWHRTHEATVLAFLDHFDDELAQGVTGDGEDLTAALDDAADAHPAPDMAAELAALRAAADAMVLAHERDDADAVARHREVYLSYRGAWLERLWQFPVDRARVASTRERRPAER